MNKEPNQCVYMLHNDKKNKKCKVVYLTNFRILLILSHVCFSHRFKHVNSKSTYHSGYA